MDHFTLVGDELDLLRNKSRATRLGFAVLLKFLLWRGRFPRVLSELPDDAVTHLAREVRMPATELASFDFDGRTAKRHRTQIRSYTGFRECSVTDADRLVAWLTEHVAGVERREDRVREELLARCRAELIEPPTPDRVTEITRSALYQAEQALLKRIADRVEPVALERLEALIVVTDDDAHAEEDVLALIKAAPGNVSLDTMLTEISKLEAIPASFAASMKPGSFRRCVSGCAARRSGSSERTKGETPTRTSPRTSRSTAPSTTTSCTSRWTRKRSPPACVRRCAPSSPR